MRCNQVTIFVERFGEYVPKDYPNDIQRIEVYCDDSTSIYAALAKANTMAVNALNEYESIGARSYVSTNEYSKADYREMHGAPPIEKNNYHDDLELQFTYRADKLRKDRIWVYEHFDEIMTLIRSTKNRKDLIVNLKEQFGLCDFQIKKLLSMRLDMLSKNDYLDDLENQKEFERTRECGGDSAHMVRYYEREIQESKKRIEEYETYIKIAENYQEIIESISQNPEFSSYGNILNEKYGLDVNQVRMVKHITIENLISTDKYLEEIRKLENDIRRYEEIISFQYAAELQI